MSAAACVIAAGDGGLAKHRFAPSARQGMINQKGRRMIDLAPPQPLPSRRPRSVAEGFHHL
ncbi:MAG: hypothetical protein RJA36_2100 [Pseudomonadota bacterium]|jgi:hypothetical protein